MLCAFDKRIGYYGYIRPVVYITPGQSTVLRDHSELIRVEYGDKAEDKERIHKVVFGPCLRDPFKLENRQYLLYQIFFEIPGEPSILNM